MGFEYRIVEKIHRSFEQAHLRVSEIEYQSFTPQWRIKRNWFSNIFICGLGWYCFSHPSKGDGSCPGTKIYDNYIDALKVITDDFLNRKRYIETRIKFEEHYKTIIHKIT